VLPLGRKGNWTGTNAVSPQKRFSPRHVALSPVHPTPRSQNPDMLATQALPRDFEAFAAPSLSHRLTVESKKRKNGEIGPQKAQGVVTSKGCAMLLFGDRNCGWVTFSAPTGLPTRTGTFVEHATEAYRVFRNPQTDTISRSLMISHRTARQQTCHALHANDLSAIEVTSTTAWYTIAIITMGRPRIEATDRASSGIPTFND
jgi:hypothetical protein